MTQCVELQSLQSQTIKYGIIFKVIKMNLFHFGEVQTYTAPYFLKKSNVRQYKAKINKQTEISCPFSSCTLI